MSDSDFFTITHTCDHRKKYHIPGSEEYQQWRTAELGRQPCYPCIRSHQADEAERIARQAGLPTLDDVENREQQIKVEITRRRMIADFEKGYDQLDRMINNGEYARITSTHYLRYLNAALHALYMEGDPDWWWSHRFRPGRIILMEKLREIQDAELEAQAKMEAPT